MSKLLPFLSQTKIIFLSLVVMLIAGGLFAAVPPLIGGDILDMFLTADDARTRITEMSTAQKTTHIWVTLILDSIYPLAYGGLLIGITAKLSESWSSLFSRKLIVLPAIITIAVDFLENAVQICALAGLDNLLFLKNILTPIKFSGLILATVLALCLFLAYLFQRITKRLESRK